MASINIERVMLKSLLLNGFLPSPLPQPHIKFMFFFQSDCKIYIQNQESTTPHFLGYLPPSATFRTSTVVESVSYEDIREAVGKATFFLLDENEREEFMDFAIEKVRMNIPTGTLPEDKALFLCFHLLIKHTVVETVESDYPRMIPASDSSFALLEKYEVGRGEEEDERGCCICLEELGDGDGDGEGVLRMPCSHVFHGGCIEKWLTTSHYCPLCRYEMPT